MSDALARRLPGRTKQGMHKLFNVLTEVNTCKCSRPVRCQQAVCTLWTSGSLNNCT
jgi:hypothetical protein